MPIFEATAPFRFCDLPREIRDKIYEELFCKFKPRATSVTVENLFDFEYAHNGQPTAILRTCKAIHKVAFEILVKRNRFVKIDSGRGVPLRMLLNGRSCPWYEVLGSFPSSHLTRPVDCRRYRQTLCRLIPPYE